MTPFYFCAHEDGFLDFKRLLQKNGRSSAFAVAYLDFVVGLVGLISSLITMSQSYSAYPPSDVFVGPFQKRYLNMAVDATFGGMLIFSIILYIGIYLQRCWIIQIWHVVNSIALVVHFFVVLLASFTTTWNGIATCAAFFAIRIFQLIKIINYLRVLQYEILDVNRLRFIMTTETLDPEKMEEGEPMPIPNGREFREINFDRDLENQMRCLENQNQQRYSGNPPKYEDVENKGRIFHSMRRQRPN